MKKRYFVLVALLSLAAVNDTEKYMIEKPDGSIAIYYYSPGSKSPAVDELAALGYPPHKISKIQDEDIPLTSEAVEHLKKVGNRLVLDVDKKQADLDKKKTEKTEACAIFKLSADDCNKAYEKGILK